MISQSSVIIKLSKLHNKYLIYNRVCTWDEMIQERVKLQQWVNSENYNVSDWPLRWRNIAGNMLFNVNVNMKRLGIRFKNDSFQWFRVDSYFWETITLYMVHFQI